MALPAFLACLLSHFSSNRASTTEKKHQTVSVSSNSSSSTTTPATIKATPAAKMPGVTAPSGSSKYDQIPGPLGLNSAKLDGKVALVTGAGTYSFLYMLLFLYFRFGSRSVPSIAARGQRMITARGERELPARTRMATLLPQPQVRFPHVQLRRRSFALNPFKLSHLHPFLHNNSEHNGLSIP